MPISTRDRKRVVVKVGSALLRHPQGGLREPVVTHIVQQLFTLRQQGHEVLLVSSGAVALGIQVLGAAGYPTYDRLSTGGGGDRAESSHLDV